ncbi:hypothetical protein B0H13DRAFT_2364741 [Mycena leptocephala]|nr:hypothetical protein B0H13DRAFT_2364741 [Mycena leptocephala]
MLRNLEDVPDAAASIPPNYINTNTHLLITNDWIDTAELCHFVDCSKNSDPDSSPQHPDSPPTRVKLEDDVCDTSATRLLAMERLLAPASTPALKTRILQEGEREVLEILSNSDIGSDSEDSGNLEGMMTDSRKSPPLPASNIRESSPLPPSDIPSNASDMGKSLLSGLPKRLKALRAGKSEIRKKPKAASQNQNNWIHIGSSTACGFDFDCPSPVLSQIPFLGSAIMHGNSTELFSDPNSVPDFVLTPAFTGYPPAADFDFDFNFDNIEWSFLDEFASIPTADVSMTSPSDTTNFMGGAGTSKLLLLAYHPYRSPRVPCPPQLLRLQSPYTKSAKTTSTVSTPQT